MSSTNLTLFSRSGMAAEASMFIKHIEWKREYFTPSVYKCLLVNAVINGLTFPFTALLNGTFILSVLSKGYLQRHKSLVQLAFLAITDLLVGGVVQPMLLVGAVCELNESCRHIPAISSAAWFLVGLCSYSSFFHIFLIACEKYIAIKYPLLVKSLITVKRLVTGTLTAWVLSLILAIFFNYVDDMGQPVVLIVVITVFAGTVYFYLAIYLEVRSNNPIIDPAIQHPAGTNNSAVRKKEIQIAKVSALVFGGIMVCYAPAYIARMTANFILPVNSSNISQWMCAFFSARTLMGLNSLCNPFIYGRRVPRFRETLAGFFQSINGCVRIHHQHPVSTTRAHETVELAANHLRDTDIKRSVETNNNNNSAGIRQVSEVRVTEKAKKN